jgi:hypothetical protein
MGKRSCKYDTIIWEWNGGFKRAEDIKVGDIVIRHIKLNKLKEKTIGLVVNIF